jgi:hypothetical protein
MAFFIKKNLIMKTMFNLIVKNKFRKSNIQSLQNPEKLLPVN